MDSECLGFRSLLHRVEQLSNPELTQQLRQLNLQNCARDAELLLYLSELDQRGLYREEAVSSLFEFCVSRLGCSEDVAYKRVGAARLMRRFPLVFDLLSAGRIHLSALMLVKPHLTEDNHREWLLAASGKSKRQVEMLVARRCPKPDVATSVRKLPRPRTSHDAETSSHANDTPIATAPLERSVTAETVGQGTVVLTETVAHGSVEQTATAAEFSVEYPAPAGQVSVEQTAPLAQGSAVQAALEAHDPVAHAAPTAEFSVVQTALLAQGSVEPAASANESTSTEPRRGEPVEPPSPHLPLHVHANHRSIAHQAVPHHSGPPAQVKPLSESSYRVTFTASGRLKEKLDRARELASHVVSPFDLPGLIERAIDLLIEREERRRCAFGVKARATTKSHRAATNEVHAKRQAGTEDQSNTEDDARTENQSRKEGQSNAEGQACIEVQQRIENRTVSEGQGDIQGRTDTESQIDNMQQACPILRFGSATAQDPGRKAESNARDRQLREGTDGPLQPTKTRSRHVPAAVRREIWKRDAGRCTFTDAQGNRCTERRFLEIEHLVPLALNGATSVENCTLRCRCHNRLTAEWIFGRYKIDFETSSAH